MKRTKKILVVFLATLGVLSGSLGLAACNLGLGLGNGAGNQNSSSVEESSDSNVSSEEENSSDDEEIENFSQGLRYTLLDDDTYAVIGIGNCTDTEIVIPSIYKEKTVTSIGSSAFSNCYYLTSIEIPDSVTSIGYSAFCNCTALTEINYNATECADLSSNDNVFSYAGQSGMRGITVTIGANVKKIPAYLFYLYSNAPKITTVVFEEGSVCESIGNSAFSNCYYLTSIEIPDSVTSIGDSAFCDCDSLTSIEIPDSVTSIGYSAFYNCTALTEIHYNATECADLSSSNEVFSYAGQSGAGITVTIGASVKKVPANLFYPEYGSDYAPKITTVTFEEGSVCESIGNSAFNGSRSLASIVIPDSVTSIGDRAFYNCPKLEYNEKDNLKYLGNEQNPYLYLADVNDTSIISVTIENRCKFIGSYAFWNCDSLTSIVIPDSVTSIGTDAFCDCDSLTEIVISDSVTSIGDWAFSSCDSLTYNIKENLKYLGNEQNPYLYLAGVNDTSITSATIENTCRFIGSNAFWNCDSLTSIVIPDSVTSIGNRAFAYCSSLKSVTIGGGVTSIGYGAFSSCEALTEIHYNATECADLSSQNNVFYNAGQSGAGITVTIGANVKKMPARLFYPDYDSDYAPKITKVVFEEGSVCESIGYNAFYNCTSLTSVYIMDIEEWCNISFANGDSNPLYYTNDLYLNNELVTELEIPNTVTEIKAYAFYNCSSLTSVVIPDSVTSIGDYAFSGCSGLTSVTCPALAISYIPKSELQTVVITSGDSIGNSAFEDCDSLTSVVIGDDVTSIGNSAFEDCDSLTSVVIGDDVTSIGNSAFEDCDSLTSIEIPDSVTSIGNSAFYDCDSLTSIEIPDSVTSIGYFAFEDCDRLTYNIKENLKYLGNEENPYLYLADFNDNSITSATIENTCRFIGSNAFYNCISLTSITIPDSVTSIGRYAFAYCSSLTSVVIPDSVTSIGDWAFEDCNSLTYNIKENLKYLGNEENPYLYLAGVNDKSITSATIENTCRFIGSNAFYNCISLTSVTIGDSVTSIGNNTFSYCRGLTSVTFNGTKAQWNAIFKGSYWKISVPATKVVCSDGEVAL